eukprot:1140097-Pelagomonas_calceolata.AAC.5
MPRSRDKSCSALAKGMDQLSTWAPCLLLHARIVSSVHQKTDLGQDGVHGWDEEALGHSNAHAGDGHGERAACIGGGEEGCSGPHQEAQAQHSAAPIQLRSPASWDLSVYVCKK